MMKRYATLRPLARRSRADVGDALRAMAAALAKTEERGRVHLRLVTDGKVEAWTIELGAKGGKVSESATGKPALEIVTRAETWAKIADGELSPLEAFLTGKLRVRGDAHMGKRIVRHLSGGEGEVEICG
jgi:putative sterol carrier protein